jgi:hypothetical protein
MPVPGRSRPVSDAHTLSEIAGRTSMLEAACSRCKRRGRYRLDTLIGRHGADAGVRVIVPELTADCAVLLIPTRMTAQRQLQLRR